MCTHVLLIYGHVYELHYKMLVFQLTYDKQDVFLFSSVVVINVPDRKSGNHISAQRKVEYIFITDFLVRHSEEE